MVTIFVRSRIRDGEDTWYERYDRAACVNVAEHYGIFGQVLIVEMKEATRRKPGDQATRRSQV